MNRFSKILAVIGIITLSIFTNLNIPFALAQTKAPQLYITPNQSSVTFLSPVKRAPFPFSGLGLSWHEIKPSGSSSQIQVRFQYDNKWSSWYDIIGDIDGPTTSITPNPEYQSAFLASKETDTFQYRIILDQGTAPQSPQIDQITFNYIAANNAQQASKFLSSNSADLVKSASKLISQNIPTIKIISRGEWGADESLRIYKETNPEPQLVKTENDFETKYADELKITKKIEKDANGNYLTWPQQYPEKIVKIMIHHTATTKELDNPVKAIRDIYYWHTVTRGWGDIGYNYIIDQQGNIYEGRAGGDGVVAAHAGPGNVGSIGIAVLGNFQDNAPPEAVVKSLIALIKSKTDLYNIDPTGKSMFRGKNIDNIIGHREMMATSCPGEKLFAMLPTIRQGVKTGFKAQIIDRTRITNQSQYNFDLAQDFNSLVLMPGQTQKLIINLRNTGSTTWLPQTYLVLNQDQNSNKYLLTNDSMQSEQLTNSVAPGQIGSFQLNVRAGFQSAYTSIEYTLVINDSVKLEKFISIPILINTPNYSYEMVSVNYEKPYLKPKQEMVITAELKNNGNVSWLRDGKSRFVLGSESPRDHINNLLKQPSNRLAYLQEAEVKPGEIGHFKFTVKAPKTDGMYKEAFTPLVEGVAWLQNSGSYFILPVFSKDFDAKITGLSTANKFAPGSTQTLWFQIKNNGGTTWTKSADNMLGYELKKSATMNVTGMELQTGQVKPGETAQVQFKLEVPKKNGKYTLKIQPKMNGKNLGSIPATFNFKVADDGLKTPEALAVTPPPAPVNVQPAPVVPAIIIPPTASNPPIRIDLAFQNSPKISSTSGMRLENNGGLLQALSPSEQATINYDAANNRYLVHAGTAEYQLSTPPRLVANNGSILKIENWNRASSWDPTIIYNEFRGTLEANWYNNRLHTINELPLEDYLKGTGEIDETQPFEKLKTIVVVSRSYAAYYIKIAQKFPGAPFNLTDDPQTSQKYVGYSAEKRAPNTVRAVNDTVGQIVTYQGKLIKTPYFSSDDGRTRSAEEVWGWKDTPYLISVPDPYCSGKTNNGHGVGLSGCGSLGMAQNGKTYQEIIKYYYHDVNIQNLN